MLEIKPKKTELLAHSKRFLVYTLLPPMSYALFFCQVKDLMKIHNRGKFHQYSICGCQVKKIQILGSNSASMIWLFEEVFGPLLPQL